MHPLTARVADDGHATFVRVIEWPDDNRRTGLNRSISAKAEDRQLHLQRLNIKKHLPVGPCVEGADEVALGLTDEACIHRNERRSLWPLNDRLRFAGRAEDSRCASDHPMVQPDACCVRKSYWWIQKLAPNFSPAYTASASWCVRGSMVSGWSASTEGQSTAFPFSGMKVIGVLRSVKRVPPPPPSGTSFRYMKRVKMRTPCTRCRSPSM
mmetsp:Transcript_75875/g.201591  ORF Transcript_75875/g.201591 Transcript_75875/m.201591 type:complete len:210 (-) Transcript_75875:533-1162(-)